MTNDLNAAVAAGVVGSEERFRELLRSVVEVARAIFGAKASSVLLLDEAESELVFEAVVGEGEETLLGQRFPSGTGVAGWVLATQTPLVIEDVTRDPRFAQDVAQDTGYVPQGLMAVPLLHEERALGVLEVLDRTTKFTLQEMDCSASSPHRRRWRSTCCSGRARRRLHWAATAGSRSSPGWPQRSRHATTRPGRVCSRRSRRSCARGPKNLR
jgi:GAF domain-containing protein